jgi:hypothetical protein
MKSEKLKAEYKAFVFWFGKLYGWTWKAPAMSFSDEDRIFRREIEKKLFEIKNMIRDHYTPKIGKAVVSELE